MSDDRRAYAEMEARTDFERHLTTRLDRAIRVPIGAIAPAHHFATPILECRQMFIAVHFFGCITLTQAVAEAVARFLVTKNKLTVPDMNDYGSVVNALTEGSGQPGEARSSG